ncbi:MAG: hypothetical protein MI757_11865, partial [Pirellulales bacterium]|nr:hypothetical protein [Pirellulales bacterium]
LLGLAIPVQLQSVSAARLREAGRGTESLADRARFLLDSARPGPARLLRDQLAASGEDTANLDQRLYALTSSRPEYRLSGGQAAEFLDPPSEVGATATNSLAEFLLDSATRAALLDRLGRSENAIVKSVLGARAMKGVVRFEPVGSPAGAPLDAMILLSGLLAEGGHLHPEFARFLRERAGPAAAGDQFATRDLETVFVALLGMANRLNYLQLAECARVTPDASTLVELNDLLRAGQGRRDLIYACALLSENPRGVTAHARTHGDASFEALATALAFGRGALDELLKSNKPLYETPDALASLSPVMGELQVATGGSRLAASFPALAYALRMIAFFGAGLLVVTAVERVGRRAAELREAKSETVSEAFHPSATRPRGLAFLRNGFGGLA